MDINESIYSFVRGDYQRDNFDDFLRKVSFKYNVPSMHIAGTNGKSTVASMLNNIYIKAGYKTGLFISSSTKKNIQDMISVNGNPISLSDAEKIFNDNQKLFKKYDLSHFEIIVFIALSYFQKEGVSLAIIECGMGGEYDATNVFNPILSIITNVAIEHADYLGVSVSEIALHKAGIVKNNVPLLIGDIKGDALDVIVDVCKRKNSKITRIGESHAIKPSDGGVTFEYKTYRDLYVPTLSKTNVNNACLVIDAVDLLLNQFNVSENALKEGLKQPLPKGKFEIISGQPTLIFDSAHNPEAITSLRKDIDNLLIGKKIYVVFASLKDKNITMMLPEIALLGEVYITTFDNPRSREESDYFLYLDEYKFIDDYNEVVNKIKEEDTESVILFTGATSFIETAREKLVG